jgi:cysteine-rich repeat protein
MEIATAVAVDAGGDVVAAGNLSTPLHVAVGKFSGADGSLLWPQLYVLTAELCGTAKAVAIDASGDVVVVGSVCDGNTGFGNAVAVKLSGTTGTELWRRTLNGSANMDDQANAVAIDGAGNVAVVGWEFVTLGEHDVLVAKLSGLDGSDVWPPHVFGGNTNQRDEGSSVAIDAAGDILVAGFLTQVGFQEDFLVLKVAGATGNELWRRTVNGTSDSSDAAAVVVVDTSGDVIAGGRLGDTGAGDDFAVVKLAGASGGEIWRRIVNSGNLNDDCRSLAVAANGDVLAAGVLTPPGAAAVANVIRIDAATGLRLWTHALGTSGVGGPAVTRDAAGDVVAVASVTGPIGSNAVVFELNGSNGSEIWHRAIDGTLVASVDRGVAVTVDGSGDVVVGGLTANVGSNQDLTVAKVSGASGGDFPCGNGAVDGGEACDDGNVDACDGCSPTCTVEIPNVCGDGILNDLCGEQCDDGDQQNGDGCNDACKIELLDDAHRRCQEGIARAGAGFAASVLKAVQGCRDRINAGRLTTVFEQCPSEPQTASTITRAESKIRQKIAAKCDDGVVAGLSLCAPTVDGLVGTAPPGCLLAEHRAAVDAILQSEYGR